MFPFYFILYLIIPYKYLLPYFLFITYTIYIIIILWQLNSQITTVKILIQSIKINILILLITIRNLINPFATNLQHKLIKITLLKQLIQIKINLHFTLLPNLIFNKIIIQIIPTLTKIKINNQYLLSIYKKIHY